MSLADFVHLEGYKVTETSKHLDAGYVLLALEPTGLEMACKRCNTRLEDQHGKHRLMPSTCLSSLTMHLLSAGGGKVFAHRAKKQIRGDWLFVARIASSYKGIRNYNRRADRDCSGIS